MGRIYNPNHNSTLPETNIAPENGPSQKETIVFQPSIFRCELLYVLGRVSHFLCEILGWLPRLRRCVEDCIATNSSAGHAVLGTASRQVRTGSDGLCLGEIFASLWMWISVDLNITPMVSFEAISMGPQLFLDWFPPIKLYVSRVSVVGKNMKIGTVIERNANLTENNLQVTYHRWIYYKMHMYVNITVV